MTGPGPGPGRRRVPAWLVDAGLIILAAGDIWYSLAHDAVLDVTVGGIACAALVLRRRFPLVAFLLTLPAVLTQAALVAPFVAFYALAATSRNRKLLTACTILAALAAAAPSPLDDDPIVDGGNLVLMAYALATAAVPALLGQLVQARHDLWQRLAEIEEVKEHERILHAEAVVVRERAQLAREMHDVVSHQVSLIAVQAGALQVVATEPATREAARSIRKLSAGTLDELRTMVTLLRASGDDATQLTPQPTLADLATLITASGIPTELTGVRITTTSGPTTRDQAEAGSGVIDGDRTVPVGTPAQRALYRTVQEALTNIRKHAPGATATVELWCAGPNVGVTVTNTPPTRPALPLPGAHLGLIGLRERADLLHGTVESGPTADGGFRVRMSLPANPD